MFKSKTKKILLFLLVAVVLFSVSSVNAEDTDVTSNDIDLNDCIYVNNSYTGDLEDGSVEHPYKTVDAGIDNLINQSKTNIIIAHGEYEIDGPIVIENYTMNIIGKGNVTLNACGTSNIFTFVDGDYTITNIKFINGAGVKVGGEISYGGAIYIGISPAKFIESILNNTINYPNLLLKNCVFRNNSATYGGAIYGNYSTILMENVLFRGNDAQFGGAIKTVETHLLVDDLLCLLNTAQVGGAIHMDKTYVELENIVLTYNNATAAGAIYLADSVAEITNAIIANNTVNSKNMGGGAILIKDSITDISNSIIAYNTVEGIAAIGGAIENKNIYLLSITNTTIYGNKLTGRYAYGSGIFNLGFLELINSTISGNIINATNNDSNPIFNPNGQVTINNNTVIEDNKVIGELTDELIILGIFHPNLIGTIDYDSIDLPAKYDLRNVTLSNGSTVSYVTPVRDQGDMMSCWAFATMAALESDILVSEGVAYDFSEMNLINVMSITGSEGYDYYNTVGGNYYYSSAYFTRWSGPVNETDDPYNTSSNHSAENLTVNKHIQDIIFLPLRTDFTDIEQMKIAILKYGAIAVMYDATNYEMQAAITSNSTTIYEPVPSSINHAVAIVGWDDNYPASNFNSRYGQPPGDGAFIIKNSWGSKLGEEGFFYVSYYDATLTETTNSGMAFSNIESTDNYKDVIQYDPLGNTFMCVGYDNETAWFKNVFTSEKDDPLASFSIITSAPQSTYEAYITLNNETVRQVNGTINEPGFHTIKLDKYVTLRANDTYEIIVKLTTPGFNAPVAIQTRIPQMSSKATNVKGHSYISQNGKEWTDIGETINVVAAMLTQCEYTALENSSVCIKAFTTFTNETDLICDEYIGVYTNPENLTGTLLDNQGKGITNQTVALTITRLDTGLNKTYYVTTDANGKYALPINLAPNKYTVEASFNGHNALKYSDAPLTNLTVKKDNKTTTILTANKYQEKYPGDKILNKNFTGQLTLEDKTPLKDQKITVTLTRTSSGASKSYTVTTDTNGNYYLPIGLAVGEYTVACAYEGTEIYSSSQAQTTLTITKD